MRDLLFKNLTSEDRKRRVISFSEIVDNSGVRTIVRRHFIYFVREIKSGEEQIQHSPYLYVLKARNTKRKTEKFVCKMKGSIYAMHNDRTFLVTFLHSLKIDLFALPKNLLNCNTD